MAWLLNSAQEQAVFSTEGRILVLAGAGSGKTRVIAHRIAHLIQNQKVSPYAILGLTFTNKAAQEMRERVEKLIDPTLGKEVTLCTFHGFCMQVLRREIGCLGYTKEFSLYDEGDLKRLIGQLIRDKLEHDGELPSLSSTYAALTQMSYQVSCPDAKSTWHGQFSEELYTQLQSAMRAYNAVSFDSLITLTIQLFEKHPSILQAYQERFTYLMIDEYQDTNPAQFRLAELLAQKYNNLCVVGDDDQSIYGWRGAEVKNILNFQANTKVKLEQNYRSIPCILDAANAVIANNQNRHPKRLWSQEPKEGYIEVFNAATDVEEAEAVIARLIHLRQTRHLKWNQMAILYRSNALSRSLELALMQAAWQKGEDWIRGIPYEIFGGLEFVERSEIKDLFSYLRILANPQDTEALLRIINVPRRGISDSFLEILTQESRNKEIPLWDLINRGSEQGTAKARQSLTAFVNLMNVAKARFQTNSLSETLSWFIDEIQYKKAIEEEVKSEKMRQFKWENVQECVNALDQYEQEAKKDASLQNFVANSMLGKKAHIPSQTRSGEDRVQLMTLHSAKGLEFPACFITGLEDHILPHEKSIAQTGIEEERRLFYVGITRAQRYLTLSMARNRRRLGKYTSTTPSRFLFEIPKHLLKVTTPKVFE